MSTYNIFKYREINKNLLDSLVNGYIYFARPDKLNDPFDCTVNIVDSLSRALDKCSDDAKINLKGLIASKDFISSVQKRISEVGICSFSCQLLNPVLWSHYGDEHRGVCLMYKLPKSFLSWNANRIIGISEVNYHENAVSNSIIEVAEKLSSMDAVEIMEAISIPMFSSKGEDWSYEEEIRVIKDIPGPLEIQQSFLTQICFGVHTSERDKKLIKNIVSSCGYNVNYCEIAVSDTDFGIVANDL